MKVGSPTCRGRELALERRRHNPHRRLRRVLIAAGAIVALSSAGTLAFGSHRIVAEQAAFRAPAAGRCTPSRLDRSAVLPGTPLSVSPLPDSFDASSQTQISLLGAPASALQKISVRGSLSGAHSGKLRPYSQGDGASFVPSQPFYPGESVTVRGRVHTHAGTAPFAFSFGVAHQDRLTYKPAAQTSRDYNEMQHFHSAPTLQAPVLAITRRSSQVSPGDIFVAPYSGPGPSGPAIFNESGELVWFDPLPGENAATNLQVQLLGGQPVLTWWQGYIPPQGFGEGEEIIDSTSYRQIGRVHAGNGYKADLHDFHITPQETALITIFNPIQCNLSAIGGPSGGAVTDSVFQELDLRTGLVRREWHSLDHVPLSESHSAPEGSSTEWPFDYFHINSIDQLPSDTTLISARNTWALYELNTTTGQISLRLGGKRSSVKGSGTTTAYQHDATVLSNGTISIFDNGAVPKVHPQSRAIVVALEPKAHTDTVLSRYEHSSPSLTADSQGNVQLQADGNMFVGWGSEPYFSEYSPSGSLLYDAHMHGSYQSYRTYRFPWTGTPGGVPSVAASPAGANTTVYASWNGSTVVASWRVLAGASPAQLVPAASAPKAGFETAIPAPGAPPYLAVQALDANGAVLGTSHAIKR